MAAATLACAGLVLCGSALLIATVLAGAALSDRFVYGALFAIGALSGLAALGFSYIAQDDKGAGRSDAGLGSGKLAGDRKAASAFLAIAYICIMCVAVSEWLIR